MMLTQIGRIHGETAATVQRIVNYEGRFRDRETERAA